MGASKKKVTTSDVAKLAGVSQSTVSLILNANPGSSFPEETKKKVYEAAKELGYKFVPRKNSAKRKGNLILVMIPTLTNPYYSEVIQPLEQYTESLGYKILVCNTFRKKELEEFYLTQYANSGISGVIYTFLPSFPEKIEAISEQLPVVLIGEKRGDISIFSIELSNRGAGALIAEHLYGLGHRKLAFISTPMDSVTLARSQRLEGVQDKMEELSKRDRTKVKVEAMTADLGESDYVSEGVPYEFYVGRTLTEKFLKTKNKITALIGANDMVALGILNAVLNAKKSVPKDYAVCGFDNLFISSVASPGLTTIDHRISARCRLAVDTIVGRKDNSEPILMANKVEFSPVLVARGSTELP